MLACPCFFVVRRRNDIASVDTDRDPPMVSPMRYYHQHEREQSMGAAPPLSSEQNIPVAVQSPGGELGLAYIG